MNEAITKLQKEAERIAARHPMPEFYVRFKAPMALARKLYFSHPMLMTLRDSLQPVFQEDLGHGLFHSSRVGLDSATLICVELESNPMEHDTVERLMVLALMAGLLHDIRRSEENHAEAGAENAAKVLEDYPLNRDEIQCICCAIKNHEAFCAPAPCTKPWFQLMSDCLYDADKFRWGTDNFTHTLWHMVNHKGMSPQDLILRFPWGMNGILRVLDTFRTATGRQYGPEIIETGIEIGKEIYRYLLQHFKEDPDD